MEISLSGEIVRRLIRLNSILPRGEDRSWIKSIFFEVRNGYAFVGATNALFAAVQNLGHTGGTDGFVAVRHDAFPNVIDPDVTFKINDVPALKWASVSAPGYASATDAAIRDPEALGILTDWRKWFPREAATVANKPMLVDVDGLQGLVQSSPSGRVVFPMIVDSERPVIIRDATSADWVGVFYSRPESGLFLRGATLPDWVN